MHHQVIETASVQTATEARIRKANRTATINAILSEASVEARAFFLTLPFAELACCLDRSTKLPRLVRAYERLSTRTPCPTVEELFLEAYGEPLRRVAC